MVRRYIEKANLGKSGACHLFRHTLATVMLEGGADVRWIQEMLGHERLDTTQVYTEVSIRALKGIHNATHPAAKLRRTVVFSPRPASATQKLVASSPKTPSWVKSTAARRGSARPAGRTSSLCSSGDLETVFEDQVDLPCEPGGD